MENPLLGKTISEVYQTDDQHGLKFILSDGTEVIAKTDADCCSHTWIENVENPEALIGSPVTLVENLNLRPNQQDGEYGDLIQFYGCKINTSKGTCVIDFRNESNGYYGGSLAWSGDDYYYGGVFGQAAIKETATWKKIA